MAEYIMKDLVRRAGAENQISIRSAATSAEELGWFTVLGLLLIAAGVISFLDPVAGAVALGAVLGVTLILEGVASILRACFADRFWM